MTSDHKGLPPEVAEYLDDREGKDASLGPSAFGDAMAAEKKRQRELRAEFKRKSDIDKGILAIIGLVLLLIFAIWKWVRFLG